MNAMTTPVQTPAVVRDSTTWLSQSEMEMMVAIARHAEQSNAYKRMGNASGVFMVLMAAKELGVSPIMALNGGIWNIDGKLELSARLINALIRKAGHQLTIIRHDNKGCVIRGKRRDTGEEQTASFTEDDAKTAKLLGKDNWAKYAEDMYFARALSRLARRLFPDLIGTAYVEGETTIEGSATTAEPVRELQVSNEAAAALPELAVALISDSMLAELLELVKTAKPEFLENFDKLIFDRYKATSYADIPAASAAALIEAVKRNQVEVGQ